MEMRKFVVELHTDGSLTCAEYTEPNSKEDLEHLFSKAMDSVEAELYTLPWADCQPSVKTAYLSGASSLAKKMCKVL